MANNKISSQKTDAQPIQPEEIDDLNRKFLQASPDTVLNWSWLTFGESGVLGTGFGPSGIVLMHRVSQLGINIPVFYLDTHLLFDDTYRLMNKIGEKLNLTFIRVSTDLSLEQQKEKYSDKLWEKDPDKCCFLRKVLPLRHYLGDKKGWITGIRRDQAESRKNTKIIEWDPANRVVKINPLAHWSSEEIWDYIQKHELPYNPLHDFGYPSIGCWPCTSAIEKASSERAGRWINRNKIECGIHLPTQKTGRE